MIGTGKRLCVWPAICDTHLAHLFRDEVTPDLSRSSSTSVFVSEHLPVDSVYRATRHRPHLCQVCVITGLSPVRPPMKPLPDATKKGAAVERRSDINRSADASLLNYSKDDIKLQFMARGTHASLTSTCTGKTGKTGETAACVRTVIKINKQTSSESSWCHPRWERPTYAASASSHMYTRVCAQIEYHLLPLPLGQVSRR